MKYFSPRYLLSISILIWFILKLIAPIEYNVELSIKALMYLIINILFFYLGTYLYDVICFSYLKRSAKNCGDFICIKKINKAYNIIAFLATLGIFLRFYDLIYLKSFFSYGSITNFRIYYIESSTNLVSILSAVLFPLCIVLLIIAINFKDKLSSCKLFYAILAASTIFVYTILRGGRTTITLVIIMVIASAAISENIKILDIKKFLLYFKIKKNSIKMILDLIVVFLMFFAYSIRILISRLYEMGFTVETHLKYMETVRHLAINDYVWSIVESNDYLGYIVYTFISIMHYFIHGFYQFILLFNYFDMDNMAYGAFQFYPIWKVLAALNLSNINKSFLDSIVETKGVYTTFWGPVLTDFGMFGFIYCFILGIIAESSWVKATKRKVMHILLYPYIASVILHSPFLNMIQSGMGLYFLIAIILSGYIFKSVNFKVVYK
ncbi:oligosaccharide repeat unit polymerase [Desulfallas sp. Bu1-1]|uniref:O-antigen polymerase n=1 Tax=Desulfallas sp. Bu1-1 TaxID=2787620 RepID=UPI00189E0A9F|nr:O-antigen polymerase [Desulfallas sp. Bu1-1]MBF7081592.1 oligosaccharide repeat unit polymerase [Desulfallas sp. Bu1-1]